MKSGSATFPLAAAGKSAMMFPMCSKDLSELVLLAFAAVALTACGGSNVKDGEKDDRSPEAARGATPAPGSVPPAHVALPVLDSLHFNLHCALEGRVVSDVNPTQIRGTYPVGVSRWSTGAYLVVDLQTMQYCAPEECLQRRPHRIARVTPDRITLIDDPGLSVSIRRSNWRYEQRTEDMGRVSVENGPCTKVPFSGFPAAPLPQAQTH